MARRTAKFITTTSSSTMAKKKTMKKKKKKSTTTTNRKKAGAKSAKKTKKKTSSAGHAASSARPQPRRRNEPAGRYPRTMTSERDSPAAAGNAKRDVYELFAYLIDTAPAIWRMIRVPSDFTLAELHIVMQHAYGWTNSHLHAFETKGGRRFEPHGGSGGFLADLEATFGGGHPPEPDDRVTLADLHRELKEEGLLYIYDLGDDWAHAIHLYRVEAQPDGGRDPSTGRPPTIIDGERAGPLEDSGGVPGYAELLEAMTNPDNVDPETREWYGDHDPETLDRNAINKLLNQEFGGRGMRRKR